MYPDGDTDKGMTLLKMTSKESGKVFGMLNWFAVHGTSMNNTNTLVSGDNKGFAGYTVEKTMNEKQEGAISLPGTGPFVGAFASSNLGDVSPNTNGPKCIDTGEDCDGTSSTAMDDVKSTYSVLVNNRLNPPNNRTKKPISHLN